MYCRIRDFEVYCEIVGEGKPIVMVHGMGVDHRTMKGRFVVLDMAGHGLQIDQAVLFNALVDEWLDRVRREYE